MANCIVFGGQGFIGSHLTQRLLQLGHQVTSFDQTSPGQTNQKSVNDLVQIQGDFLDYKSVFDAMKNVEYVFHYISTTFPASSIGQPNTELDNITGSLNIMRAALENNIKNLLFPSSGGTIYGEPEQLPVPEHHPLRPRIPYAITKVNIENLLEFYHGQFGLNYTVLRPSNPYGPGQKPKRGFGVISTFLFEIAAGRQPTIFGDGSIIRDYIYISDLVEANILAMNSRSKISVFNVGSGEGVALNQLIDVIRKVTGRNIDQKYEPIRKLDISKVYLDTSLIRKELSWSPKISLEDGISKMWSWVNANKNNKH